MRRILLVASLLLALASFAPAAASAALTATQIRIGNHPAFVRVVVDFTGGTLNSNDVESPDPLPFDGGARVRVTDPGVATTASALTAEGVAVHVLQRSGFIVVTLHARRHRFKYLEHSVLHSPERLLIDLWKARPPTDAAEFLTAPQGGCLTIENLDAFPGRVRADGTETDLFEHMFQADVRNAKGRVVGIRPVTASAGHWQRTVRYDVGRSQPGTYEVVDFSEQDGSLSCIAQIRVPLAPAP